MKRQRGIISLFYTACILLFEVLYFDNAYFNIMEAKANMLKLISVVFFMLFLVIFFISAAKDEQAGLGVKRFCKSFGMTEKAVIAFACVSIVSSVFSGNFEAAVSGDRGWGGGAWMYLTLAALCIIVSRSLSFGTAPKLIFLFGGFATFIWSLLNVCGADLFGMHEGIYGGKTAAMAYLAGIGNSNSMAGYVSMLLPAAMILFTASKKRVWKCVYAAFVFLGFACAVTANCDGVYIGMAAAVFCTVFYSLGKTERLFALPQLGAALSGAVCFVKLLRRLVGTEKFVELTGISARVCSMNMFPVLFVLFAFVCIALYVFEKKNILSRVPDIKKLSRPLRISLCVFFAAASIASVAVSARSFDDSWGSYRGYIWRRSLEMFSELGFGRQLFGVGPDCFGIMFSADPNASIPGAIVLNAHNEWIQYLVTTGFIGVAAYAFFIFAPAYDALHVKKKISASSAAMLASIAGYAAQAVVNNPQPLCLSILFLLISFYISGGESADPDIGSAADILKIS